MSTTNWTHKIWVRCCICTQPQSSPFFTSPKMGSVQYLYSYLTHTSQLTAPIIVSGCFTIFMSSHLHGAPAIKLWCRPHPPRILFRRRCWCNYWKPPTSPCIENDESAPPTPNLDSSSTPNPTSYYMSVLLDIMRHRILWQTWIPCKDLQDSEEPETNSDQGNKLSMNEVEKARMNEWG